METENKQIKKRKRIRFKNFIAAVYEGGKRLLFKDDRDDSIKGHKECKS